MFENEVKNERKSIKVNALMNVILQISTFIFPLITFPYISRVLLPEGTGKVNMAVSFVTYFVMLAQLGIPTYGIIQCAKVRDNREELTKVFNEIFFLNVITTIVSYVILAILILAIPRLKSEKILYFIVSLNVILGTIGIEWLYQALEEYTYITVRSLVIKVISIAAMFLLVKAKEDYVIYAAILVASSGIAYIINFIKAGEYVDIKPATYANIVKHIKPTMVFFAVACTTTIYTNLDNVMLGFMTTDTDVGYYSAAVKIKTILVSIITALGTVLLPRASYSVKMGNIGEFNRVTKKAMNLVAMIAIPIALYFMLYAEECILFIAGDAYGGSALPMKIIMPTIIFIGFTNIIGFEILVPTGREIQVLYSTIVGATVDIIINAILIPRYQATGAAIGTLIAELAVLIYQICVLKQEAKGVFGGINYWRITLGVIVAVVAALFLKNTQLQLFFKLVISALVFFGIYGIGMIDVIAKVCFGNKTFKWEHKMSCHMEYFKAILIAIKKKIVGIIVIMLICGIALGGFGYVKAKNTKNYVDENKRTVEEYESKIAEYETAIHDTEDYIELQQEQIDSLQKYMDESIIMSLDGEAIPTSNIQWTLTSESADKNAVLTALMTYILEGGLKEAVNDIDDSMKTEYWNEVMSVNTGADTLSVSIMQPTEKLAQESIEIIAEIVRNHLPELTSTYGYLALKDEAISTFVKADAGVVNTQNSYRDTLKNYKNIHSDQNNKLAGLKDSLKKYKEKNAPEVYEDISNTAIKNAIKYAVIGIVMGLIIGIAIVVIDYCMCGRLRIAEDVKKYGLRLIAKQSKNTIAPNVERACMDIETLLHTYSAERTSICCLSDDSKQVLLAEKFEKCLQSRAIDTKIITNPDTDADSMTDMVQKKYTCLVLSSGETELKKLEEIIAMCKQYGIMIIGCIVA